MTRGIKYSIALLLLFLMAFVLGAAGWLLGTTDGARWLMGVVSSHTGVVISADRLEGRLAGNLRLENLHVKWAGGDISAAAFRLRLRPSFLLLGKVVVSELNLKDLHIRDNRAPAPGPPDLTWPRVSGFPSWINVRIGKLRVDGLEYRKQTGNPFTADVISARVRWRGNVLTIRKLALSTPSVKADGVVMAGFLTPSLLMKLNVIPAKPVSGVNRFTFETRLFPAGEPEQAAGPLKITGLSGDRQLIAFSGEIGITRNSLNLRKIRLKQPGRRGEVTGKGSVVLTAEKAQTALKLYFAGIDLSRELHGATDLSGSLDVTGSVGDFKGNLLILSKDAGWKAGRLSGTFRGSESGVRFTALNGELLEGTFKGTAEIDWQHYFSFRTDLSLRNINPAKISPDWKGKLNADLKADANFPRNASPNIEMTGLLLESSLQGRELTGAVDLTMDGGNLLIRKFALKGKGFDIDAQGDLRNRLILGARIDNLSGLLPSATGSLNAKGWLRWREGRLSGAVDGKGRNLEVDGIHAATVELSASLSEGAGFPLVIRAGARGASYGGVKLGAVELAVNGRLENHTIEYKMHSTSFSAQSVLIGGYKAKAWQGTLTSLSGRDAVGPWKLRNPAALRISPDSFLLSRLVLDGAPGEYLEGGAQIDFRPLLGSINLKWRGVNLERFSPILEGGQIAGSSSGEVQARLPGGDRMNLSGRAEASGTAVVQGRKITVRNLLLNADWNNRGTTSLVNLNLAEGGAIRGTFSTTRPAGIGIPSSGTLEAEWDSIDMAMIQPWLPKGLDLEGQLAGRMEGTLSPGQRFSLKGNTALVHGSALWKEKENQYSVAFQTAKVSWRWQGFGKSDGTRAGVFHTSRLALKGRIDASGQALVSGRQIDVQQVSATMDWDDGGMRNTLDVSLADGGVLRGELTSALPAATGFPRQGNIEAEWKRLDLSLLGPWLTKGLDLQGDLSGQVSGTFLPDGSLNLQGSSTLSGAEVRWNREGNEFDAKLSGGDVLWTWRGHSLSGDISLALENYGRLRGSFQLPVAARLPVSADPAGPVVVAVKGHVAELGFLTSLFPGLIQESSGELDLDANVGGHWQNPEISGNFKLAKAAAYLPSAGIHLKNAGLTAHLSGDRIIVDSFGVDSGPGHLGGSGVIRLKSWHMSEYEGNLKGDRFQVVYLPELQVLASPDLQFSGTPEKLAARGEIRVPELIVRGQESRAPVLPSSDVVIAGEEKAVKRESSLPLDVQITVVLGDKVEVKYQGIDARLKGSLKLSMRKLDEIRSTGEIRVVKGSYKTYGINLDITRGRIYYAGGSISQPRLDIQALRKVGDVRAGVQIAGTPATMSVKLYSEPNMPDSSILSYIVLGQPLAYNSEQTGLITRASGQLISTTSAYTPIQATPPGVTPSKTAGSTLSQSMVSIGRYLTPSLYVSIGRSLLTGANLVHLRYDLSRHWEVETQTGTESGGDLFFKINFK